MHKTICLRILKWLGIFLIVLLLLVFLPDLFGGDDEPKQKKKRGKFEDTRNS